MQQLRPLVAVIIANVGAGGAIRRPRQSRSLTAPPRAIDSNRIVAIRPGGGRILSHCLYRRHPALSNSASMECHFTRCNERSPFVSTFTDERVFYRARPKDRGDRDR